MTTTEPLEELRKIVSTCVSCSLHSTRTQTVFDRGSPAAPLMIVGEAPGKDEDKQGFPFVGRAGQLLADLLKAANVPEDQIYMANVLKCRPPKNKFPQDGPEPETCRNYLLKQIDIVQPKAIIVAGKQALRYALLHGTHEKHNPLQPWINKQFRRKDLYGDIRFLCVYHPAYLIRRNDEEDQEEWINAVAKLWLYVQHKLAETPPALTPFKDIRPAPDVPRQGRNLFGSDRKNIL